MTNPLDVKALRELAEHARLLEETEPGTRHYVSLTHEEATALLDRLAEVETERDDWKRKHDFLHESITD